LRAPLCSRATPEDDEFDGISFGPETLALALEWSPQRLIGRVVVDDLHAKRRIVDRDEGPDRLDHQLRRLVVGRDLEADGRPMRRSGGRSGSISGAHRASIISNALLNSSRSAPTSRTRRTEPSRKATGPELNRATDCVK